MSLATDIERCAEGAPIVGCVIGAFGWGDIMDPPGEAYREHHSVPMALRGVVLPWDTARDLLDYDYSRGYGAPDCHAIAAWTASRVIFITTYDGSTGVTYMPRHPFACTPNMVGGG